MHVFDYKYCDKCFTMYDSGLGETNCKQLVLTPDPWSRTKTTPIHCGGVIQTHSVNPFTSSDVIGSHYSPSPYDAGAMRFRQGR